MRFQLAAAAALACGTNALAHNPILIARTADGQLTHHIHALQPEPLNPSVFPEYPGWADFDVAVEALEKDEPSEGLFTMDSAADIELMVMSSDTGVRVAFNLGEFVAVGSSFNLGHSYFHYHPAWNIFQGQVGEVYGITFQLHDRNGIYTDSEPFVVNFTPIPSPAGVLAFGVLALARSRRR